MIGRKSNYLADLELNAVLGGAAFPTFTKVYFAWLTDNNPDDQVAAGVFAEVNVGSYTRVAVTGTTGFAAATSGTITLADGITTTTARIKKLTADVQFPTAANDWGLVRRWAIFDALTGGNLLYFGNVGTAQTVYAGNAPYISATDGFIVSER